MLNKVQLIGRVGKEPELRMLQSGNAVANFSIATSERFKDKNTGEMTEKTEWHNISTFGRLAEIVGQYVHKGSLLYVEGKLQTRKYTDRDGVERYMTDILANEMKMLNKVDGQQQGQQSQQQTQQTRPARQQQSQSPMVPREQYEQERRGRYGSPQQAQPPQYQSDMADESDIPF